MADEHFLTTEEVLDYLQVNLRTVYRLIKSKKLPATRVGRQWRFRRRDLDIWLANNRTRVGGGSPDRPRILVVDDEESVRDLIARSLSSAEYDVDTAEDGATAVDRLQNNDYDLLITS
jgi:excisionase family DNA binding protein